MRRVLTILFILLLIGAILFGAYYIMGGSRGSTAESTWYTDLRLVSEGEVQDESDIDIINKHVYFSLDYIKEHIDPDVFFDEVEEMVIFTNDKNVRRYKLEELEGTVNDVNINLRSPILKVEGKIMVPEEAFAYDYDVDFRYIENDNLVLMDRTDRDYVEGIIKKDTTWIRESDSKSSPIIRTLNKGDKVIVYRESGNWILVRQIDGRAGWVEKKFVDYSFNLEDIETIKDKGITDIQEEAKEPINLVWDYFGIKTTGTENVKNLVGVNTMSPTWFSLNKDLTISDKSNPDYTKAYQRKGVQVWPMFDNNFDPDIAHNGLKLSSNRQKIISNIVDLCIQGGYEGINVDFENIKLETRDLFTQFIREMYPIFKEHGLILSVDVVPRIHADVEKEQYDRKELAKTCDYMMLMAYDQHWSTSPTAGSVAEYTWVEANSNVLFRDIPMDKFILGLPLYTRIWFDDGQNVTSQAVSMEKANQYIKDNNIDMAWDSQIKQYVGSKNIGGNTVSIWLEDKNSLREKASLSSKYNFAGVASWRLGFETLDVWPEIDKSISK